MAARGRAGVTTEDDKVVDRLHRKRINGRVYRKLIRVRELQRPGRDVEFKLYARGVGIVQELPPTAGSS